MIYSFGYSSKYDLIIRIFLRYWDLLWSQNGRQHYRICPLWRQCAYIDTLYIRSPNFVTLRAGCGDRLKLMVCHGPRTKLWDFVPLWVSSLNRDIIQVIISVLLVCFTCYLCKYTVLCKKTGSFSVPYSHMLIVLRQPMSILNGHGASHPLRIPSRDLRQDTHQ